jgi:hypothetical protein
MKYSPEEFIRFIGARGFHLFPVRCVCGKVFDGDLTAAIERGIMRGKTLVESVSKLKIEGRRYFMEGDEGFKASMRDALDKICCRVNVLAVELHYFPDDEGQSSQYKEDITEQDYNDFGGYPAELGILEPPMPTEPVKRQEQTTPQVEFDVLRQVTLLIEPGLKDFPLPIEWDIGDELSVFEAR